MNKVSKNMLNRLMMTFPRGSFKSSTHAYPKHDVWSRCTKIKHEPIIERYLDGSEGIPFVSSVSTILVGMGVLHYCRMLLTRHYDQRPFEKLVQCNNRKWCCMKTVRNDAKCLR